MANNFNTLYFLKGFNNYFNRIIKKYDTLEEYEDSTTYYVRENRNFNPNDGVATEHIENCILNSLIGPVEQPLQECDYVLVLDGTTIVSRWFITECERQRNNQYKFILKRDVLADNFETILNAPCFIEKGTLQANDPLLFNKESMTFNQIKTDEFPLKDKSGCAWIVGYIARNYLSESSDQPVNIKGKYNVNYSSAINHTDLPWDFVSTPSIVGVTSGYTMNLSIFAGTEVYTYGQYRRETPLTANAVLNYDKYGTLVSTSGADSWSARQGSLAIGSSSLPYNLVNSTSNTPHGKDVGTYINNHRSLGIASIPQAILDEQQNAQAGAAELLTYNNKIVKVEAAGQVTRYYRLRVETVTNPTFDYTSTDYPVLSTNLDAFVSAWNADHTGSFKERYVVGSKVITLSATFDGVRITPELISQEEVDVDIPIYDHRIHLNDGPYDMFCIPYGNIHLATADIDCNKDAGIGLSFYIAAQLGKDVIYDLQLLPYCPVQNFLTDEGTLMEYGTEGYEYCYIRDTQDNIKSILIWCMDSSNTFNINKTIEIERPYGTTIINQEDDCTGITRKYSVKRSGTKWLVTFQARLVPPYTDSVLESVSNIEVTDGTHTDTAVIGSFSKYAGAIPGIYNIGYTIDNPTVVPSPSVNYSFHFTAYREKEDYVNSLEMDTKVSNECDLYRIVSPNFNGQFELSLAKNGGSVTTFNVDYTYKPYAPYIHVNPEFKGLYGQDWDDARGLICGGDFSLPMVTDAFTDFQVQNKNYQAIFDREIQNMDINNAISKQEAAFQAVAGTFTGAATGAATGAQWGGGWGAAIGAVAGAGMSAGGGIADYNNLIKRQEEAKSFKTDMYGYQLGNIQALPYSLSKTSAFTYNNKIFPIVEYYTCTEEEKKALRSKLKYDGMTVMKVGTLAEVTVQGDISYVKGQMIRLESLIDDSHMAYTIYEEINKGVYL